MKPVEAILVLPTQARFVNSTLAFIRATAASCGFSDAALNDIEGATEEALTNVIKHAYEGDADATFKLSVSFTELDFSITIFEKGIPFNPDGVVEFTPQKLQDTLEADGLGFFLMKKLMDDVVFENLGREGKSLTLTKHISSSQSQIVLDNSDNAALLDRTLVTAAQNAAYQIRPFKPEDALGIATCAYKAYGYTYEPYIYYPEKIIEMNRLGTLRSFVAVSKDTDEVMGHLALKYKHPADLIAEIGVGFVKPEFRRSGVLGALMHSAHNTAKELKLHGLFARAVTSHAQSQKVADALGYFACGLSLGFFPDDVDFKALTGKIKQKESCLLIYLPIHQDSCRIVYLPLQHASIIREIFALFNIAIQCANNSNESCDSNSDSKIQIEIIPVLNVANIEINAIGHNTMAELGTSVYQLRLKHVDAIFIYLDMEDACSPFVVEQCEKMDFFFSGILPFGLNGRHTLVLQYMNNLAIDYSNIKPFSRSALDLLQYVKHCDPNKPN